MASVPIPPRLKAHHGRQAWRTRWYDDTGKRREHVFGFADSMTKREAMAAYRTWLTEWTNHRHIRTPEASPGTYTCQDLAIDYLEHAKKTFTKHGRLTSTVSNVAYAMQAVIDGLGLRPADEIEGPDLAKLRDAMIHGEKDGEAYTRSVKTVNDRLYIIKQAFRWARERGRMSGRHLYDLMTIRPLQAGRCEATAPREVGPVDEHWVELAKPWMSTPVRVMVELQWLTGMRPGDAVIMRPCDIDRTEMVWLYEPTEHKMEHKGLRRVIPLGPRCQKLLKPLLDEAKAPDAWLFSPRQARREKLAARRKARQTPRYPSHMKRNREKRVEHPQRAPGERYTEAAYRRGIHYACRKAAQETGQEVPPWSPNQLRHAAATRLNRQFALEDVSVMLGHTDLATTRIYALPAVERAVKIAKAVG